MEWNDLFSKEDNFLLKKIKIKLKLFVLNKHIKCFTNKQVIYEYRTPMTVPESARPQLCGQVRSLW